MHEGMIRNRHHVWHQHAMGVYASNLPHDISTKLCEDDWIEQYYSQAGNSKMFFTEEAAWYKAIKSSRQHDLALARATTNGFASGFKQRLSARLAQSAIPLLTADAAPNPRGGGPRPRRCLIQARHRGATLCGVVSSTSTTVCGKALGLDPLLLPRRAASLTTEAANDSARRSLPA